jgi:hypothetical protein
MKVLEVYLEENINKKMKGGEFGWVKTFSPYFPLECNNFPTSCNNPRHISFRGKSSFRSHDDVNNKSGKRKKKEEKRKRAIHQNVEIVNIKLNARHISQSL